MQCYLRFSHRKGLTFLIASNISHNIVMEKYKSDGGFHGDTLRLHYHKELKKLACSAAASYPSGGVEFSEDKEDVLLARLQSTVIKATIVQLVPKSEECRQGGGSEAGGDVGTTQVHLPLPWVMLLLANVLQQLKEDTQLETFFH